MTFSLVGRLINDENEIDNSVLGKRNVHLEKENFNEQIRSNVSFLLFRENSCRHCFDKIIIHKNSIFT